ncbi:methyl-accepting chemotaxis protein [Paraburkholderia sp. RAU6.4a]|uniref:methyl-accepting chemotaxis protein n=1 Tax=unclassified Paraburkholderia TaxID=2615204 RepID=UPI00292A5B23|nr:methyl-accepting chemotaxis protein [Paraburkholderia sp. UCT2]
MQKSALTIRLKLMIAFGTCATLMCAVGLVGILGLWHLDGHAPASYRLLLTPLIAVALTGCVITVSGGIHLHRVVCGGLNRMSTRFEEIATTLDLSMRARSPRMDEFGRAAVAFDRLMRRVEEAMSAVHLSTDSVATATREIAAGNLDLSVRTEEQASSLDETASNVTQLAGTVRQNAENAYQAQALASDATDIAATGDDVVQAMVGTIEKISGSSNRISEITGVIEGIAFQTNILALNAAVEAARAGEQGRGFAVVASEVRSLAQRSAGAAREIKDLIASSVATIREGSHQAIEVSTAMSEIKRATKRVSDIVSEIAGASEEQGRGIEQVNQAVIEMDLFTQQNAALVEQAAAAAQSLEDQAAQLRIAVSSFRLTDAFGNGLRATDGVDTIAMR